jgi:hypothetical protein
MTASTRSNSRSSHHFQVFIALSSFSLASTQTERETTQKKNKNAAFLLPSDRLARFAHCFVGLLNTCSICI